MKIYIIVHTYSACTRHTFYILHRYFLRNDLQMYVTLLKWELFLSRISNEFPRDSCYFPFFGNILIVSFVPFWKNTNISVKVSYVWKPLLWSNHLTRQCLCFPMKHCAILGEWVNFSPKLKILKVDKILHLHLGYHAEGSPIYLNFIFMLSVPLLKP